MCLSPCRKNEKKSSPYGADHTRLILNPLTFFPALVNPLNTLPRLEARLRRFFNSFVFLCCLDKIDLSIYVDQTGVGEYIVEDMKESGIPAVKGIILTMHEKEAIMTFLKQKMLNRQIAIPHINELIAELNIEKFEVTSEGRIRFNE